MGVELFQRVYEEFKGKELPPEFGMKNALKNIFGVASTRIDIAYRSLMDSAQDAGFFDVRGSRTHLIMPAMQMAPSPVLPQTDDKNEELALGGGNGGGNESGSGNAGGARMASTPGSLSNVKARYIETLIKALEEKGKNGELDEALMTRIEKLLEAQS
jgi:hypothetical protein